ncbi:hypothetical protein ACWDE0_26080 [Streptomyces sp. 900105755]
MGGVVNRIVPAQATPFAVPLACFDGAVLFRGELGGQTSYVWSYPQIRRHSGLLDRTSGMVVGVPEAIDGLGSPEGSWTLAGLLLDVLGDRAIPVLGNAEIGHPGPNLPMPLGIRAALDTERRTLSLPERGVRAVRGGDRGCTRRLNRAPKGRG